MNQTPEGEGGLEGNTIAPETYDRQLEQDWWAFVQRHDLGRYPDFDLLVLTNTRGIHSLVIPAQTDRITSNERVRVVGYRVGRHDQEVAAIIVDPLNPLAQRRVLVDRRPAHIREQFPLVEAPEA